MAEGEDPSTEVLAHWATHVTMMDQEHEDLLLSLMRKNVVFMKISKFFVRYSGDSANSR